MRPPISLCALAFLSAVAPVAARAAEPSRPNILFIAVDDLRTNLGCYGDAKAKTPHLDALAARGVAFTRAYAQQAVCNPSRQSLLSGRRPDSILVWDLRTSFRTTVPDLVPLPEHFQRHGYFTQGIGKIYHEIHFREVNDPASWSVPEQFEYVPKREDYRRPENRSAGPNAKAAVIEFADAPDEAYPDGRVATAAEAALEALARDGAQTPFFLAVGFRKPHLPFTAPQRYWDLHDGGRFDSPDPVDPPMGAPALALHDFPELRGYAGIPERGPLSPDLVRDLRRAYYAATTFVDAQIGRVVATLARTGLAENTIVVVWGDHGFHLGEHGLWAKTTNYEADVRVPLIVAVPGLTPRGARSRALVELLDLYPTLVELCRLDAPPGLEGRSLVPWLEQPDRPGPAAAFSQFPRPWAYREKPEAMGYSVRTDRHRYVEWRHFDTGRVLERELYSYAGDDLQERVNVAADPAQAELLVRLAQLLPPTRPASAE